MVWVPGTDYPPAQQHDNEEVYQRAMKARRAEGVDRRLPGNVDQPGHRHRRVAAHELVAARLELRPRVEVLE